MSNLNRLVVVSGGSKGIGKAIIERFAAEGFDIATYSRNSDHLEKLSRDIQSRYGVTCITKVVDASVRNEVESFGREILALNREISVLVNNAGSFVPGAILEEEEGAVASMIETNLYSAYFLTRIVGPVLKSQGNGHVFNICSIASFTAYTNGGSYAISKHALLGFSRVLREELKTSGVKVTAVHPGATFTSSWEGAGFPEERFISAGDIAETVFSAYSLSPSAVVEDIVIRPQLGDI